MTPAQQPEYCEGCPDFKKGMAESGMGTCQKLHRTITWQQWCILRDAGCGIRSRPVPAPEHRTYESCHKKYSCPDGEECWYNSEDYYWDVGDGATRLLKAARTATLAERQRWMDVLNRGKSALKELDEDGMRSFHSQGKLDVIEWIEQESLRGGATQQGGSER